VPQRNASRDWLEDINHGVQPIGESIALDIPGGEEVHDNSYTHNAKYPGKNDCRSIVSVVQNSVFNKEILEREPVSEPPHLTIFDL
jgi:hypothetical protein